MPNWTYNTMTMPKEVADKYVDNHENFDFNSIIKMPETLNIMAGTTANMCVKAYLGDKEAIRSLESHYPIVGRITAENPHGKASDDISYLWKEGDEVDENGLELITKEPISLADAFELGRIAVENKQKYGAENWYEWCSHNWGTKWNACETQISDLGDGNVTIDFNTAWDMPTPIFEEIAKQNPAITIEGTSQFEEGFYYEWEIKDGVFYRGEEKENEWEEDIEM